MRLRYLPSLAVNLGRALLDSHDVEALLRGEELSSIAAMRRLPAVLEAYPEGRALLRDRPQLTSATVDLAALRRLPQTTLGGAFVAHLDRNGLDLDALAGRVSAGDSREQNWLLERVRQTHDIWHTVLGLDVAPHEEVLAHAFQWAQLHMPYSWLVVGFGTPKHFLLEGRWRALHRLPAAYQAGERAQPLIAVYWERHWSEDLDRLRERLGILTAEAW